jgi:2-methylcitrate dehydratase
MPEPKRDETVERIVEFVQRFRLSDIGEDAVTAGLYRVVDTVGCAVGGAFSRPAQIAADMAYEISDASRGARIWGELRRTSLSDAAFANGTAVRYLDYNDTYRSAVDVGHPSDNLAALLACGEEIHATGEQVLEALVVAYEVQCRFTDSAPFNDLGWDQPTTVVMSAAMGVAKLLGLTEEQTRQALSLAIVPNMASQQTRAGELSMWKGCAAAMGAAQGLRAARFAQAGMRGPEQPIEGPYGLWKLISEPHELAELGGLAPLWGVQQSNIKTYPVRDSCQLGIQAALKFRDALAGRTPGKISLETYRSSYKGAAADPELWAPKTRETADHSLPVAVAIAILDGDVTVESYEHGRFADHDVLDLISRLDITVNDEFSKETPGRRNMRIESTLEDGDVCSVHTVLTREEIERGVPREVIEGKFRKLTAPKFDAEDVEALLDLLWNLGAVSDVTEVVDRLAFA